MENLKQISTDLFWCYWTNDQMSFGHKGLPEDIHFTIVYGKHNEFVNLHISRNKGRKGDKPRLTIVKIERKVFFDDLEKNVLSMVRSMWTPLNLSELKDEALGYISFDSLKEDQKKELFERLLVDGFQPMSKFKKKGKKLVVEGDVAKSITDIVSNKDWVDSVSKEILEFNPDEWKTIDGGMILTQKGTIQVIKIADHWLEIKGEIGLDVLMQGIISKSLLLKIRKQIKQAIFLLKDAESYIEVEKYDIPIILRKNQETQ